jgi:hypothetical protein
LRRPPEDKIITKVGPLFVHDPFCRHLPAIIVGMGVIEPALSAASEIPSTMSATVLSAYLAFFVVLSSTKHADHVSLSSITSTNTF